MLCCLFLIILRFSAIRNLPLGRRVKATYSILKSLLLGAKKKTLKACQLPQFLHRIRVKSSVPVNFQVKFISTAHAASFSILTDQQIRSCVIDRPYLSPVQVA